MSRLSLRDKEILMGWIHSGASLAEVEAIPRKGLVGNERFSEATRRKFRFLWMWAAPRYGVFTGLHQEMYYDKYGRDALMRRISRVRRLLGFEPL